MNSSLSFAKEDVISKFEKIGYALGDGAANIAWRAVATFLFIFYTDVFGLDPAAVGLIMLIARFSDGISDVIMGIIGDRTKSKYGHFRPWILWTAIPLAISLSLLFTTPGFGFTGKLIYAYVTYIVFTLVYTANNIPYGALMAVVTSDHKERTSFGSYRMVGAFAGGMLVQGALLFLVSFYGNINPTISIKEMDNKSYYLTVTSPRNVDNVIVKTDKGVALLTWANTEKLITDSKATSSKSFKMDENVEYSFILQGESNITTDSISIIDQKNGYSKSIYILSIVMAILMIVTFFTTRERVLPLTDQDSNLWYDFKDLINNKPWLILLVVGLLFNVYNNIKQGIVVIYFTHYINQQLTAGTYLVVIMIASIAGAMATAPLGRMFGKRNLFIYALLFSAVVNAALFLCGQQDIYTVFLLGAISEFGAAIFPTLFFAMLGDVADYSEFMNNRRATGLVYSAGSFATKFGGGIAGVIIGYVLGAFGYNGRDTEAITMAIPGIQMLMSWIPSVIAIVAAIVMVAYPLSQNKLDEISTVLELRRKNNND